MTSLALCTALCPETWGVLESRRWGDDAVMTKREHDECRRRHAKAALEYVIGKLSKAERATALPPAKKLVTPPSSVCDLDETVDVDELVVAPESAIVSDSSDSDEDSACGRGAGLAVDRRLEELEARHAADAARLEARLVARLARTERNVAVLTRLVVGQSAGLMSSGDAVGASQTLRLAPPPGFAKKAGVGHDARHEASAVRCESPAPTPLAPCAAALRTAVVPRRSPPPKPARVPPPAASVATAPAPQKPAARAFEKRGARAPQGGFGARKTACAPCRPRASGTMPPRVALRQVKAATSYPASPESSPRRLLQKKKKEKKTGEAAAVAEVAAAVERASGGPDVLDRESTGPLSQAR